MKKLGGARRHDGRRPPQAPLGRDEVALDLHPPQARLEGRGQRALEEFKPPLPLVGSGPYTVTKWNPDGTTVLERNPYFRRANSGPQRVLMTYYGDRNAGRHRSRAEPARRDAERTRSTCRTRSAAALDRRARLPARPRSASSTGSSTSLATSPRACTRASCRSRAIRTALAWAIDRTKLVQAALLGYGAPGNTQLPRSYGRLHARPLRRSTLGYHYDPARARRILDSRLEARPRRRAEQGRRARRVRARLRRRLEREAGGRR